METITKIPDKISRTILHHNNMILKLHVKLINENNTFHNIYTFNNKDYINIQINGFLTLEIRKDKNTEYVYDSSKSFLINMSNIGIIIKALKKVLKSIYTEDIFAIQNNKIIAYSDMVKKHTEQVVLPRISQALLIQPAVIYDENETTYEGVNLYLNNTHNVIPLSIDEYENFVYILDHFDIFNASQLLLNYYISYIKNNDIKNTATPKRVYKNIDWLSDSNKTVSNYRKEEDLDLFKGL